jgi:hypothetical protein
MDNRREHQRTLFQHRFALFHPDAGVVIVNTRDFSESGVFLVLTHDLVLPLGTEVEGQLLDLAIPAPRVRMVVIRHGDDGMGMRFADDPMEDASAASAEDPPDDAAP